MATDALLLPEGPWLHPLVAGESAAWDLLLALQGAGERRVAGRRVRGRKARTTPALFDEFAAALQFPYYFGENWNAFDECLTDLEWLPADVYTLLIADAARLLEAEAPDQLAVLLRILEGAGRAWGQPLPGPTARGPRPFHVLLQCTQVDERALREKLEKAQVSHAPIG